MSNIIIAIEGNIGVGKTTFLDILKNNNKLATQSTFISEPINMWLECKDDDGKNILDKFYCDKIRWGYSFQSLTYITKMTKLVDAIKNSNKKIIFLDRSIDTDKYVFAKMLYDDKCLTELEYKMYNMWNNFYDNYLSKSQKKNIIYLRCDPQIAKNRICKRGRTEEQTISMEYLQSLHKYHEQWMEDEIKRGNNVLILDWNKERDTNKMAEIIMIQITNFIEKISTNNNRDG